MCMSQPKMPEPTRQANTSAVADSAVRDAVKRDQTRRTRLGLVAQTSVTGARGAGAASTIKPKLFAQS